MLFLKRRIDRHCPLGRKKGRAAILCICGAVLGACSNVEEPAADGENTVQEVVYEITRADNTVVWSEPEYLDLSEEEGSYTIVDGGEYILSGQSENTLFIDAEDQMVHLYFDNLQIEAEAGAAVEVRSAGKVIVTLLAGTSNILQDSPAKRAEGEGKAAFYSTADVTVNGSGKLQVYGYYDDGIRTRDVLKILGGEISVRAKGDGIRGNDGIYLIDSELEIQSGGNGLVTTDGGKRNRGLIAVKEEKLSIISGKYAIACAGNFYVNGSSIFMSSVFGDMRVDGEVYAEEGSFENE